MRRRHVGDVRHLRNPTNGKVEPASRVTGIVSAEPLRGGGCEKSEARSAGAASRCEKPIGKSDGPSPLCASTSRSVRQR